MKLRKINKKGDATDPFIILLVLFFLAVAFIIGIFVNTKIQSVITTTDLNTSASAPAINSAFNSVNTTGVQRGFAVILFMMVLFTLLSAFLVRQHPAFIFINIILLIVTIFVSVFLGNVYGKMLDNATLAAVMNQQTIITYVMTHIVKIVMAIGGLNMLILFSKLFGAPTGDGGGL